MDGEAMAAVFNGVASLLWPLLAVVAVFLLRGPIGGLVDSVGRRGGSVKLAGFEVNVVEATEQQQKLITDLQVQLGRLHNRLDGEAADAPGQPLERLARSAAEPASRIDASWEFTRQRTILWVDAQPEASAALQGALEAKGVRISHARSIEEAVDYVAGHAAAIVVSSLSISGQPDAGVELVKRVKQTDPRATVYILCAAANIARHGGDAVDAGAQCVTDSPVELIRQLARLPGPPL